jgi:endonuclease/exonuclease/phosphatase family metal-dependent hydrolase
VTNVGVRATVERMSAARVLTLNLAHGRGTGFHQALTTRRAIVRNLDAVADLILAAGGAVVALQVLDAATLWSGGFDHLAHLARRTGLAYVAHGIHGRLPRISYGTGVLSRWPIPASASLPFRKNLLDTKGYILAHVEAPFGPLDVVSLHLDFKRAGERRAQLADVSLHLERREDLARSLIVAGDFNTSHDASCGTLSGFVRRHGLFVPEGTFKTFPSRRPRRHLDHVLISPCLEVVGTEVMAASVSDHLPVLVEVRPKPRLILPSAS